MAGPLESICVGPAELGTDLLQGTSKGADFVLRVSGEHVKIGREILMELDFPPRFLIMIPR